MCRRYLINLWIASWLSYFNYMISIYPSFMAKYWGPYLLRPWHEANCTVTHSSVYQINIDKGFSEKTAYFTSLQVQVNITNQLFPGFSCGSPDARSGTLQLNWAAYPTEYTSCPAPDVCGRQELLPLWTCAECYNCDELLAGEQTCLWRLVEPEGVDVGRPGNWPLSYSAPFPMPGTAYIHVVLGDSVYYSLSDFIGLQIAGLTGIFIPPVLLVFWIRRRLKLRRLRLQAIAPQAPQVQPAPPIQPIPQIPAYTAVQRAPVRSNSS